MLAFLLSAKKKDGFQRLIIDARAACAAHRTPPTTRLGSARCMADLDLSDPRLRASGFGGLGEFGPEGREGDVGTASTITQLSAWPAGSDSTMVSAW